METWERSVEKISENYSIPRLPYAEKSWRSSQFSVSDRGINQWQKEYSPLNTIDPMTPLNCVVPYLFKIVSISKYFLSDFPTLQWYWVSEHSCGVWKGFKVNNVSKNCVLYTLTFKTENKIFFSQPSLISQLLHKFYHVLEILYS